MKKALLRWELVGFVFVISLGSLLHFVYDWSDRSSFVACFAPVNESTWEHLKLLFFPSLLYGIVEYIAVGHKIEGFVFTKFVSILLGLGTIVVLFYTYTGIVGGNCLWADIGTFVVGAALSSAFTVKKMPINSDGRVDWIGLLLFAIMIFAFCLGTFFPPHIGLFLDPVTLTYGIS